MANKTKVDRIHDELPRYFKTKQNPNWKALIETLGESDQKLADLTEEVRKQFFIKTASRPYIDRLGANYKVSRPKYVGMQDNDFRKYIPVLAYQPKQVKLVMDLLLDIFFFKETTTAFTQSTSFDPFVLKDGWELEYKVDQVNQERIVFKSENFTSISAATADEIVGAINRQALHSFAIVFDDRIQKKKFIRVFSNTIGAKGSIQMIGGRANIGLKFKGYNEGAGSSIGTTWAITKIGDTMKFQHIGGSTPNLNKVQIGDIAIIDIPNNIGSFVITDIDLSTNSFSFVNLFGTAGTHTNTSNTTVSFITPLKLVIYNNDSRSVVWEVSPGQIIVEMPASPPVVKRSLTGSGHLNGFSERVQNRLSATTLEIADATDWPLNGGEFVIQELKEIKTHVLTTSEDIVLTKDFNTRFDKKQTYRYTSKTGNILSGITPNLPGVAELFEANIATATRAGTVVTIVTTTPHNFLIGEGVKVQNTVGETTKNGTFIIKSTPYVFTVVAANATIGATYTNNGQTFTVASTISGSTMLVATGAGNSTITGTLTKTSGTGDATISFTAVTNPTMAFTYSALGPVGVNTGGVCRIERVGMSNDGSIAHLTSAQLNTGILGPYEWDLGAAFVISSLTSTIQAEIKAGNIVRTLEIASPNNIEDQESYAIFDFGTEFQEGPVRILYKPTANSIQLDPAYIFKQNHEIGSSVTIIRKRGAIVMSGLGKEYSMYVTDPSIAREILQDLIKQVKSVGIFIEFLIRYPQQVYGTFDVYKSGSATLYPIGQQ
jgi:hypothetical protein